MEQKRKGIFKTIENRRLFRLLRRSVAMLLIFSICLSTTDFSVLASGEITNVGESAAEVNIDSAEINVDSTVDESSDEAIGDLEQTSISDEEGIPENQVFSFENAVVKFEVSSSWINGFNTNVIIRNTGDIVIEDWCIEIGFAGVISNIWNAKVMKQDSESILIKNLGWNQDIAPGEWIQFGYTCEGAFESYPYECKFVGESIQAEEERYSVKYTLVNDWISGFTGNIEIQNLSEETLEDWSLEFEFEREITTIWNADILEHQGSHYVIKNAGHNANILPNAKVVFGFNGEGGEHQVVPENYLLYSYDIDQTEYVELEDGKIEKAYLEQAIYKNMLLRNLPIDNVKLADDFDGDGLTLIQEYEYDTHPFQKDSDEDGLNDYDEIFKYRTNPIKSDTDDDGLSDGTEIACGADPLSSDTNQNGILDGEEVITQPVRLLHGDKYQLKENGTVPSVLITGKGDFSNRISLEAVTDNLAITGLNYIVGTAYDFVHDKDLEFESSTLTFKIDNEIFNKYSLDDLAIFCYDLETGTVEFLETVCDYEQKTVSAEVKHYSIYSVGSRSEIGYLTDVENESSIITSGKADVVFVVDTTGSMGDEIRNVRNNIEKFVSVLEEKKVDIRLGLVEYKDIYADGMNSTKSYDWYTKVDEFKNQLGKLGVSGGGDRPESVVDALNCARNMKYRPGVMKYIILLTDADYKNGTSQDRNATMDQEIDLLCEDEISVSVVTTPGYYNTYADLVNATEGVSANINQNFATALEPLINKMALTVNAGCWVRLSDGSLVRLDKNPKSGDIHIDTDRDGIPDLRELIGLCNILIYDTEKHMNALVEAWTFKSNPAEVDTDGDTIDDKTDEQPKEYNIVPIQQDDNTICFNTGRIWHVIPCSAHDFLDNLYVMVDGNADHPIDLETFRDIVERYSINDENEFNVIEMAYLTLVNHEGARLYMHSNYSASERESVFKIVTERESRYYKHMGFSWNDAENWSQVPKGTESGFWAGVVWSEVDINCSCVMECGVQDIYSLINTLTMIGALVMAAILVRELTFVVATKMQALAYYVKTFGILQGINMYRYLGVSMAPNGVISWLEADTADGDSCFDDIGVIFEENQNVLIKDGFGKLSGKECIVTQDGINTIEEYFVRQGFSEDYENVEMIKRLEAALNQGARISGPDAIFYTHELYEAHLVATGIAQEEAHRMALAYFEVSPYSVYAPEVIEMEPKFWNQQWFQYWDIK